MSDLFASRREKLDRLRSLGIDPWGSRFDGQQPIGEVRRRETEITVTPPPADQPDKHGEQHGPRVRVAGRIVLMRDTGKLIFLDLRDWTGQVQALYRQEAGRRAELGHRPMPSIWAT